MAIILLDTKTINRIAAGEVIERPAKGISRKCNRCWKFRDRDQGRKWWT